MNRVSLGLVGCNWIQLEFDGVLRGFNLGFHDNNSTKGRECVHDGCDSANHP